MLWLLAMTAAMAADLNGWDGIPFGSTKGGPKDPAMANDQAVLLKRATGGQVGVMQFTASLLNLQTGFPKATFAGVRVNGVQITYIDGEAGEFVATLAPTGALPVVDMAQMKAATDAFTASFGQPLESGAGGSWSYFETSDATITLQLDRLTVRSKAKRDRCAELFGAMCELLRPSETAALMTPAIVR